MAPSNFGYSLREAGHHFVRNGSSTFGAVVTIFLSLFIIGLFAMGSVLLDGMVGTVEDQVTIQAFLSDDASQDAVDALQSKFSGWSEVESVAYKSKAEALAEYRETMTQRNASDAVAALDDRNPIPASIVIKLHDPQDVENVAKRLGTDSDFAAVADVTTADDGTTSDPADQVQYGQGTVERLFTVTNWIRVIMLVLVALLTFVAFVFINNTIRLSISRALHHGGRAPGALWLGALHWRARGHPPLWPAHARRAHHVPELHHLGPRHAVHLWAARRHGPHHRPVRFRHRHEALPQGLGAYGT